MGEGEQTKHLSMGNVDTFMHILHLKYGFESRLKKWKHSRFSYINLKFPPSFIQQGKHIFLRYLG